MAQQYFDIRKSFREISNELLKEYFLKKAPGTEIDWNKIGKRNVDELFRNYSKLAPETTEEIYSELDDLFHIYTHPDCPQIVQQLIPLFAEAIPPDFPYWPIADKCLWIQMNCDTIIKEQLARLIELESVPDTMWTYLKLTEHKGVTEYSEVKLEHLRDALSWHMFQNFGYGRNCEIEPLIREKQAEECFFIYLDKPGRYRMKWDSGRLVLGPDQNSYEMLIVYNYRDNVLKIRAPKLDKQHKINVAKIWSDVMKDTTLTTDCLLPCKFDLEPFKHRENIDLPNELTDDIDMFEVSYARLDLDGRNRNKISFSYEADKDVMESMEKVFANPATPCGATTLREIHFHIKLSKIHSYHRLISVKFTRETTNWEGKNHIAKPVLQRLFQAMGLVENGDGLDADDELVCNNHEVFQHVTPSIERMPMVTEGGTAYVIGKFAVGM